MERIKYIFILLALSSCSSTWHLNKAIKKEPTILHNTVIKDTIQITKLDSVPYAVNNTIHWKYIERITDTIIEFKYKYITAPITRQEKRLKAKVEKTQIKQESKTKRTEVRKQAKKNRFNWFTFILIGIFLGVLISFMLKNLLKRIL
jgi:hypothetical protein